MNDISPEAIAAIARRIYSEIPGMSLIPKTETEASAPLSEVPGWPGHLPAAPPTGVSSALPSYAHGPVPGASHPSMPSGGPNGGGLPAPSSSPSVPPAEVPFTLPGFTYGPFPGASPEGLGLPAVANAPFAPPTGVASALPSYSHAPAPGASHPSLPSAAPNGGGLPAPSTSPSVPPAGSPFTLPGFTYGPFPGASPEGLWLPAVSNAPIAPPTGIASALPSYSHPVPGGSHPSVPNAAPGGSGLPAPSSSPSVPPVAAPFALPGFTYGPFPGASPEGLGLPSSQPSLPRSTPEGFSLPATSGAPSAPTGGDGLSAFVRSIQSAPVRNERGQCAGRSEDSLLQRLFASKSAPPTGARPLDVVAIRKDFPILNQRVHGQPLAWLDNGATTQKPQSVIDAISSFYENDNSNIHRGAHTLAARATDAFEQARQKVQTFLGASSSKEIIFVRGTTEGINLVAQAYGRKFFQPGDEIILSTLEHHANIVPWQMVAKERGAVIRVIPVNDRGEVILEEYQALLGPRTRFVSLTHASNSLGTVLPVAEMTQLAKRHNARVLIDGAQSVSHFPVNVQEIGADFFVFSGHKIFGPTGIGAVYATQEVMEIMPPWQGGGSMIKDVTFEETKFSDPPAKFEAGTPNIADAVGLGAALDYVNRLGRPAIAKYEHELLEYATTQLSGIDGLRIIGTAREKVGVISFVLKDRRTEDVGRMLDQEGIAVRAGHHCAQPSLRRFGVESTVRPSLSFYNTHEEIDRLTAAILRILRQ